MVVLADVMGDGEVLVQVGLHAAGAVGAVEIVLEGVGVDAEEFGALAEGEEGGVGAGGDGGLGEGGAFFYFGRAPSGQAFRL